MQFVVLVLVVEMSILLYLFISNTIFQKTICAVTNGISSSNGPFVLRRGIATKAESASLFSP